MTKATCTLLREEWRVLEREERRALHIYIYICGCSNVKRALARHERRGLATD